MGEDTQKPQDEKLDETAEERDETPEVEAHLKLSPAAPADSERSLRL